MPHFMIEHGYETEMEARQASRDVAVRLIGDLQAKGYSSFKAPEVPPNFDGQWDVFSDCRIMIQYILPFLPSRWADKFALRVDTLAEQSSGQPVGGA